jgi:hypothetical protein
MSSNQAVSYHKATVLGLGIHDAEEELTIVPVVKALASLSSFIMTLTHGNRMGVTADVDPSR